MNMKPISYWIIYMVSTAMLLVIVFLIWVDSLA